MVALPRTIAVARSTLTWCCGKRTNLRALAGTGKAGQTVTRKVEDMRTHTALTGPQYTSTAGVQAEIIPSERIAGIDAWPAAKAGDSNYVRRLNPRFATLDPRPVDVTWRLTLRSRRDLKALGGRCILGRGRPGKESRVD